MNSQKGISGGLSLGQLIVYLDLHRTAFSHGQINAGHNFSHIYNYYGSFSKYICLSITVISVRMCVYQIMDFWKAKGSRVDVFKTLERKGGKEQGLNRMYAYCERGFAEYQDVVWRACQVQSISIVSPTLGIIVQSVSCSAYPQDGQ